MPTPAQVTCEHELRNGEVIPTRVHTVVISVQHSDDISNEDMRAQLKEKVKRPIVSNFIAHLSLFTNEDKKSIHIRAKHELEDSIEAFWSQPQT